MSIQTCTNSNREWLPLLKPYTGTKDQPDTVSIFYKHGGSEGKIEIADEGIVNLNEYSVAQLDKYSPFAFTMAVVRVEEAVKLIFEEFRLGISRENSDLWNAFKNLVRGALLFIPLLGNVTLYLHDKARNHFCFHSQIKTTLARQNQPLLGIAFDGKIIVQFSLDQL
jgi:hypothetical protein